MTGSEGVPVVRFLMMRSRAWLRLRANHDVPYEKSKVGERRRLKWLCKMLYRNSSSRAGASPLDSCNIQLGHEEGSLKFKEESEGLV